MLKFGFEYEGVQIPYIYPPSICFLFMKEIDTSKRLMRSKWVTLISTCVYLSRK